MVCFGERLKALRKNAQLTQAELAEKLMLSVQSISKWECNKNMPDISQIVPLAAVLGVTTDCLLGVGGNETADREKLDEEIQKITKGIEKVYWRQDNAYYACYALYKEHITKYPLDFEVKLLCADSLLRFIYYGTGTKEDKDRFYQEAINLLMSVINYDRDATRLIDAQQTLIILYLYHNDFANAEHIARKLPERGGIRASMEIEIFSKKNDHDKCLETANRACNEAVHIYLWALAVKAKRISLLGVARKQEAIAAWRDLLDGVKFNCKIINDISIHTKWLYSAYCNLSNDYLAISEFEKAFEVIEELTHTLIRDYNTLKESGENTAAEEIKQNFSFYLHNCYNLCFQTDDNVISNASRFKNCELMLDSIV